MSEHHIEMGEKPEESASCFTLFSVETPPKWVVHICAITVQVIFGIGNCIGKEALKSMPPLIFAFYREFFAGIILIAICVSPDSSSSL